jgi:hypothetical protein
MPCGLRAMTSSPKKHLIRIARWGPVLLCLATLPGPATAAESLDLALDLKGMSDATLGVSQLTTEGAQCGLDLSQIGHAASQLVVDAGIGLHDAADSRITISAVTARIGADQCATAVMLGVYVKESFFSSAAGWVQSGYVVLWQRSLMVATPIGQHATAVAGAARRLSAQLLEDWRAQNRTSATPNAAPGTGRRVTAETRSGAAQTVP